MDRQLKSRGVPLVPATRRPFAKSEGSIRSVSCRVKKGKGFKGLLLLLPLLLLLTMFTYYPFLKNIGMSFTLTNIKGEMVSFAGWSVYKNLFSNGAVWQSLKVSLLFVPMVVVPALLISTILAALCRKKVAGTGIFSLLFSLPVAVSSSCVTMIFMTMLDPNMGLINSLFGLDIKWYLGTETALLSVAMVVVWSIAGIDFLFLISAVRSIPASHYESIALDGREGIRVFFRITLPSISPTLFFLAVMNTIMAFQAMGPINIMTKGGPSGSTNLFSYSIYQDAFFNFQYSQAAAKSLMFFLLILIVTILQMRMEKKAVFYQ